MKRIISLFIQGLLILAAGFAALQVLTGGNALGSFGPGGPSNVDSENVSTSAGPEAEDVVVRNPTLVNSTTIDLISVTPEITALGQVSAWQESTITSETSGRVIWINPNFEDGIAVLEGEVLVRLNSLTFQRDVLVAQIDLDSAQEAYLDAQADTEQARAEFSRLDLGDPTDQALKIAELEAAELAVRMAELDVEIAEDTLEDTEIRMPYDGTITDRDVSIGDQISATTVLGDMTGTSRFKLVLAVLDSQIGYISSGQNVILTPTNGAEQRKGRVVSIDLKLDPSTLLNSVIVEVRDPLSGTPIRIGSYLRGAIEGPQITDVLAIPLTAISNEGYFFEISDAMTLVRHNLEPAFRDPSNAYIPYDHGLKIVEQDVLGLRDGQQVSVLAND